jgi:hypothetical protein
MLMEDNILRLLGREEFSWEGILPVCPTATHGKARVREHPFDH